MGTQPLGEGTFGDMLGASLHQGMCVLVGPNPDGRTTVGISPTGPKVTAFSVGGEGGDTHRGRGPGGWTGAGTR